MIRKWPFIGSRVVKTGVAVFLTAWICNLFDWPPVFAVITAIVTLEPTVSDSIKKGLIRFPASAIGSFYAVLFISLFGNSPITYTFAAVFTIATCFKLKLHAGLLVATLTAVAMIEVIHSHYLIAFFIRLGTTTIGLVVSTVVNMFVLPPDYTKEIAEKSDKARKQTGEIVEKVFKDILDHKHEENAVDIQMLQRLDQKLINIETLIRFQREESKFHPLVGSEKEQFQYACTHLQQLRLIHYHLDNLIYTPLQKPTWSNEENDIILEAVAALGQSMKNRSKYNQDEHIDRFNQLMALFWEDNEEITKKSDKHPTRFPPELIILYELISIYKLVTRYYAN
ncbi:FUSC family protein [Lentibacillus saliphilus]|uniref:FUSC family protein n=1 Tax=Lentibacillus saliphilus TaxID=2737028 RepID=UPI001FE47377|nr:aromatic acid exporter family protein [Lentibacillus saliphilus]